MLSARLILGTVFLMSAISKLAAPGQFANEMHLREVYRIVYE